MSGTLQIQLGGKATVHCLHDRQKRQVVTEAQVARLGREVGQVYDPRQHKLHLCGCCQNLFVDPTDTPRLCEACSRPYLHTPGGPPPEPIGVI